jgi:hypothetical protein
MLLRLCLCLLIGVSTLLAQAARGDRGSAAGGPQSGPPPPPPATDCAVSGTVVNAVTGEPIPRATVSLGGPDASGSATDATGHWSISNTTCGSNRALNASRIGFIANGMAGSRPTTVNLVSGSPVSGVKISLMPESSIAGRVLDPDGDPIESARIQALKVMVQAGQRMLVNAGASATDSQGNFRIGGLQPGRYVICAGSPQLTYPVGGGPAMAYRDDCYPGPASSGISIAMPVEAGREVRTSFTLNPMPGVHVRGRASGLPATATRSSVQLMKLPRNLGMAQNLNAQVRTDGSFDIATVAPGSYIAMLNWQTNPPGPQPVTVQAPVEVGSSDVDNVSLTFQPGGSLSGTVHYQFSNTATPANPPVTVNLRPASNNGFFGPIPQAQWDSDHLSFSFANVPPGSELRLLANVNGREVYVRSATLRGQDVINQPFTVEGTAGPIDIVVSDDTGSIDVTVNDNDGHPVADASVILLSTSGLRRILSSGDDGHAIQKNLPVGEYRAWAFENLATVPYAEEDWMNQNAGPGEKVSITSGGAATLTVKQLPAPKE